MKKILFTIAVLMASCVFADSAFAAIKYINGYTTKSGQYRSGHYRDTSNDGNQYNNANYLGYND